MKNWKFICRRVDLAGFAIGINSAMVMFVFWRWGVGFENESSPEVWP